MPQLGMSSKAPPWGFARARSTRARAVAAGYRSGLEEKLAAQIAAAGLEVRFEKLKVDYEKPASKHKYTPDFELPNGIIVEGKGVFSADDRAKHLLVKAQRPDLDIRFVFTRSKAPIYKGSPTTNGSWCEKHGFPYADKVIPPAWFKEKKR